jgi:hypothetical protein
LKAEKSENVTNGFVLLNGKQSGKEEIEEGNICETKERLMRKNCSNETADVREKWRIGFVDKREAKSHR